MKTTNLVIRTLGYCLLAFVLALQAGNSKSSPPYKDIWVESYLSIVRLMDVTFSTIPENWCEDDLLSLPATSDEGETGVWGPARDIDVSGLGGTTITVTFTPDDTNFNPVSFDITIDARPYLGMEQTEPLTFCKLGGDIIVDLVDTLDLQLDQIMTLQGDGQLFSFIAENSFNPSNFETELRNLNIKDIPSGPYTFFVESAAINECLFTTQSFSLEVLDLVGGVSATLELCFGNQRFHDFEALIEATGDGIWEEKPTSNSGLNLSSPTAMDLSTLATGAYIFDYIVFGAGPCIGRSDTATLALNILNNSELTFTDAALSICGKDNISELHVALNGRAPYDFVVQLTDDQGNLYPAYTASTTEEEFTFEVRHTTGTTRIENDIIYLNQAFSFYTLSPIAMQDAVSNQCFNPTLNGSTLIEFQFAEVDINESICASAEYQFLGEIFSASRPFGSVVKQGQCDTTFHINLSFLEVPVVTVQEEICENESITLYGETFSANQLSSNVLVNSVDGCDTIYNVSVTLKNRSSQMLNYELCPGEFVDVAGTTFNVINNEGTVILTGANGCDSIVNINVTEKNPIHSEVNNYNCEGELTQILCPDDSVVVDNEIFHIGRPSGTVVLTSFEGCDSIIHVNLTYFLPVTENHTDMLCESDVRMIGGVEFNKDNPNGVVTLTRSNGCDSIINVDLTFQIVEEANLSQAICQGESFDFGNGVVLDESLTAESITVLTPLGCDSVINYSVTFNPTYQEEYIESLCEGESRTFGGETFDANRPAGTVTFTSAEGCDSVLNVNLQIDLHSDSLIQEILCNNEVRQVGAIEFNIGNPTGSVVLMAANGCDSTVTVDLTYGQTSVTDVNEVICQGESYDFGNCVVLDENNTAEILNLVTSLGCDSVINYSITVNPTYQEEYIETLCEDESRTFASETFDKDRPSGVVVLSTLQGCDSVINVNLQINLHSSSLVQEMLCDSDVRIVGSAQFDIDNPSGVVLLPAANGCDSAITVDLTYGRSSTQEFSQTICDSESYDFGSGVVLDASNTTQAVNLVTPEGCDSVLNYSVIVNPSYSEDYAETLCDGDSRTVGGETFDIDRPSGVVTLTTTHGCDSVISVNLTVNSNSQTLIQESLCDAESVTVGNEQFDINRPNGVVQLTNANGCDSLVSVDLIYGIVIESDVSRTICAGDSYNFGNGVVLDENNTAQQLTLTSALGCDSIVSYSVDVRQPVMEEYNPQICQGGNVVVHGEVFHEANPSGVINLQTMQGCDSILNVNIIVAQRSEVNINEVLCTGQSYTVGGTTFTSNYSGTIRLFGQNQMGCDSFVHIQLAFVNAIEGLEFNDEICPDEQVDVRGEIFDADRLSGEVLVVTPGACDTLITVNLRLAEELSSQYTAEICEGGFVDLHGERFDADRLSGQIVLTSAIGCDSTVFVGLQLADQISSEYNEVICEGDFTDILGEIFDANRLNGKILLSTTEGCDSTLFVNIEIAQNYEIIIDTSACSSDFGGTVNSSDVLSDTLHLISSQGCDSVYIVNMSFVDTESSKVFTETNLVNRFAEWPQSSIFETTLRRCLLKSARKPLILIVLLAALC